MHRDTFLYPQTALQVMCAQKYYIIMSTPPLIVVTIDAGSGEDVLAGLLEAIAELPPCNKDTLAYLILHIQKSAFNYIALLASEW